MPFFQRRRSLIGLDLGARSIKAVEFTVERGEPVVTGYGQAELPSGSDPADALAELARECDFNTRRVATAVSGRSVIVRFLSMPEISESNLRQAIRFEADRYVPFELDEIEMDCVRLAAAGDKPGEIRVLLVAAKRDLVRSRLEMIRKVGFEPVAVDVDAFCVSNAFELAARSSGDASLGARVCALVDVGATKTTVSIVRGHEPRFTREVYLGGEDVTTALSKRLGIDEAEAESLKRDPQERLEEVQAAASNVVDELANEIQLSFDYFEDRQGGERVDAVFVGGGGALLPGFEETIERTFERPASRWSPVAGLAVDGDAVDVEHFTAHAPQLAVAVGLASRALKGNAR